MTVSFHHQQQGKLQEKKIVRHYIDQGIVQTVDVRQALHMVIMVLGSVTQSTISNNFRLVQIILTPTITVDDIDDGDDMPLSQLKDLIRNLPTQLRCLPMNTYG
ncbi:hypothetical protein CHS0354_042492 [Potamilus streckersoni]|uniref:Uncharacterized protein n=1 Tax=Potamilus streckersoni TaxID=2493646 RepID=A0AAE0S998_9BIVA|nr:hypothetical protein CHS0354_042492 [Potamilus streckersoni]